MKKINIFFYIISVCVVFFILWCFFENSTKRYLEIYKTDPRVRVFSAEMIATEAKTYSFVSEQSATVQGLEVYLATYGRWNFNKAVFELYDLSNKRVLFSEKINTLLVMDNSFYTIKLPDIQLKKGDEYRLSFVSLKDRGDNFIAVWKDVDGKFVSRFFVWDRMSFQIEKSNLLSFNGVAGSKAKVISVVLIVLMTGLIVAILFFAINFRRIGGNNKNVGK